MIQRQNYSYDKKCIHKLKTFLVRASMSKFLQERFPGAFVQDKREISILKVFTRKFTILLYPFELQKIGYILYI